MRLIEVCTHNIGAETGKKRLEFGYNTPCKSQIDCEYLDLDLPKYCRCGGFTRNIALSEILAPRYKMRIHTYRERKLRKLPFPSLWAARLFTELLAISHSGIESPGNAAMSVLVRVAFHSVRSHTQWFMQYIKWHDLCVCRTRTSTRTHTLSHTTNGPFSTRQSERQTKTTIIAAHTCIDGSCSGSSSSRNIRNHCYHCCHGTNSNEEVIGIWSLWTYDSRSDGKYIEN